MMDSENWDNAWWLTRVIFGAVIHVFLIILAIFNVEIIYEVVMTSFTVHPEKNVTIKPCMLGLGAALSMFTASMAGVYWVKSMYIKFALPELIEDEKKKSSSKK